MVVGIDGQAAASPIHLNDAENEIARWLQDLGLDTGKADQAKQDLGSGAKDGVSALIDGRRGDDRRSSPRSPSSSR